MKLAISALLALLVATMICSGVRADVMTPQSLLLDLRKTVLEVDNWIFKGYTVTNTRQLKNALARKIDATIDLYDITDTDEARDKLQDDIRPKLTDPYNADGNPSKLARSWLQLYPHDSPQWEAVTVFAIRCQGIIETILAFDD